MSIADKITRLTNARNAIRTALIAKGILASDHGFEDFAEDVGNISTGYPEPVGTKQITANGTYDVKDYANAEVNTGISLVDFLSGAMFEKKVVTIDYRNSFYKLKLVLETGYSSKFKTQVFILPNYQPFQRVYQDSPSTVYMSDASPWGVWSGAYGLLNVVMRGFSTKGDKDIPGTTQHIYVEDSLVDRYKTASVWSYYAELISGYSTMPAYDNAKTYTAGDCVRYDDKSYIYISENDGSGNIPTGVTDDYWYLCEETEVA